MKVNKIRVRHESTMKFQVESSTFKIARSISGARRLRRPPDQPMENLPIVLAFDRHPLHALLAATPIREPPRGGHSNDPRYAHLNRAAQAPVRPALAG